eukprot:4354254-Prymnesium_polylepis.1
MTNRSKALQLKRRVWRDDETASTAVEGPHGEDEGKHALRAVVHRKSHDQSPIGCGRLQCEADLVHSVGAR